ncbi:MAG TPA: PQQ-dependent sugar dehydrogenase [Blastocatellia bacterium]|nr:PQQ-dependent sugar dehydrogenase [Blastocatellia bacterium]
MKMRTAALFLLAVVVIAYPALTQVSAGLDPESSQVQDKVAAPTAIQLEPVFTGLSTPVYVTNAHDGTNRMFVVEKVGNIRVAQPGATSTTLFLNISSRVLSTGNEQGLLGLAFHPMYSSNGRFFVYYTRPGTGPDSGTIVIAEYHVSPSDPNIGDFSSEIVLLTIQHPTNTNHNGGMIEFGPDGYLYAGVGDGGSANDPPGNAQNTNALLGKILRIDVDNPNGAIPYSSPPSNPFFGSIPGADEIYAYGMRNPWRWAFDRTTGQLWCGDVGQGAREEIDIITLGGNYGWRVMEGMICNPNFNGGVCTPPTGSILPIADYTHSGGRCSITGGYVYRGGRGAVPSAAYIYADYCTGEIFTLQGGVQSVQSDTSLNITSFGEDEAREVYVVGQNGTVSRIASPSPPPPCTFSLSSTGEFFSQGGGDGSFGVICSTGCNWIVASNVNWITITSNSLGSGTDTVTYTVRTNSNSSSRTGTISVAGQTLTVAQAGSVCTYLVDTATQSIGSGGGVGAINVAAAPGCSWTAVSNSSWIVISSGASGIGNGTVMYSVAMNPGPVRVGAIKVARRIVTIKQKPKTGK